MRDIFLWIVPEGDDQDEVAEYEGGPEDPIDHVVSQHLQEEGRADDGEHHVGAVRDIWVPAGSNGIGLLKHYCLVKVAKELT